MKVPGKCIFFILFATSLYPATPETYFSLKKNVHSYSLQPYLYFFRDRSNSLTIDEIIKQDGAMFEYHEGRYPSFGFNFDAQWGKFLWKPGDDKNTNYFLVFNTTLIEDVTIYIVDQDGKYREIHQDAKKPFHERIVQSRKMIFPLNSPSKPEIVYFKVRTLETMEIPLLLFSPQGLARQLHSEMFFKGMYYGIVLFLLLYNFVILISIRDQSYFYYVFYLGSYILAQAGIDGFLDKILLPENYQLARNFRCYLASFIGVMTLRFASAYLDFPHRHPRLNLLYKYMIPVVLIPGLTQFFAGYKFGVPVTMFLMFFVALLQTLVGAYVAIRSNTGRFYFFAWFFFFAGVMIFSLQGANIFFPGLGVYAMQMGNAAEATILSFGLAYRVKMLQRENLNLRFKTLYDRTFPHFLFNSLASVIIILENRLYKKAADILTKLSELYQFITYKSFQETVSLKKELEFCEKYLSIMRIRFGDLIDFTFSIAGNIDDVQVPPFTIQPVIENAIKHGFENEGKMHIWVTITSPEKNSVIITVENDGRGLNENNPYSETLKNTLGCLEIFYETVNASIQNRDGGGVAVNIKFSGKKRATKSIVEKSTETNPFKKKH